MPPPVSRNTTDKLEIKDRLLGKVGRNTVNYRPASDSLKSCAECRHYKFPGNPTSGCDKVAGLVYAEDTCDEFAAQGQQVQVALEVERESQ